LTKKRNERCSFRRQVAEEPVAKLCANRGRDQNRGKRGGIISGKAGDTRDPGFENTHRNLGRSYCHKRQGKKEEGKTKRWHINPKKGPIQGGMTSK